MKRRWIIAVGLLAVGAICAALLLRSDDSEKKAVEETRRALHQQGFKTDLTEFNFSTSSELRAREAILTAAARSQVSASGFEYPNLMASLGLDSAIVIWRHDWLPVNSGELHWQELHELLDGNQPELAAACDAALSGPIRFDLVASHGDHMLLPQLAVLKRLSQMLGTRAVLELHDGNKDAAWTNLLASARLVTAWDIEPVEVSQFVRHACTALAYNTTWQAFQMDGWADEQLAQLQHEWESVDFFKALPETTAFTRACMVAMCQQERQRRLGSPVVTLKVLLSSPRSAWSQLTHYWSQLGYRQYGTYEDEKALLLFYRDRELELRRAVQCPTWSEMRQLPGVTNTIIFQSKYNSRMQVMMNLRQVSLSFQRQGGGLLGRAAEAEARRRIIIAAIALERYRSRHGSYPKTLPDLVPELLKNPPIDFMDGKPLRYRLTDDGHFVLYSVGLDCIDNGEKMQFSGERTRRYGEPGDFGVQTGTDLVWPCPASIAEVETMHQSEVRDRAEQEVEAGEEEAIAEWNRLGRRQARAEKLLARNPKPNTNTITYHGRPLAEVLRNGNASGTNRLSLDKMLTLRPVITGGEPENVTFEVPVSYDVLTNLGELCLYIDPSPNEDSDEGCNVGQLECNRAANGNCLLVWSTIYESPGKHALQMGLVVNEMMATSLDLCGPVAPFVVSNLCQFSTSSAHFNRDTGANLFARLPESNGLYTVELKTPAGAHLKTIRGSTSNGVINVHWDLTDDRGRKCTNDSFDTFFQVTLPDSGRSQTMNGP